MNKFRQVRVQAMSSMDTRNYHKMLQEKQALISQKYKKSLQAKALMNHYQNNELNKMYNERNKLQEKIQQMQWSKEQNQRHLYEIQMKKQIKQYRKNQYSKNYDEMINLRKQREQQQKHQQLWLQKRLLNEDTWLRDTNQQKQIEKLKRQQYGKELEKHLKLQEEKRNQEAARIKQQRDRLKQETYSSSKNQRPAQMFYKGKSMLEQRNSQNLGVKGLLNWSQSIEPSSLDDSNVLLTPRMDQMLKMQHQRYYEKGQSTDFKNEQQKQYFQRNDPQKRVSPSNEKAENYNPITNPIPFKYKNPNVLKVLASFS